MPYFFSTQQVSSIVGCSAAELALCSRQHLIPGPVDMKLALWSARNVISAYTAVQLSTAHSSGGLTIERARLLARRADGLLRDIDDAFLAHRTFTLLLSGTRVNILVEGEINRETPGYIKVSTRSVVDGMRAALEQELAAVV